MATEEQATLFDRPHPPLVYVASPLSSLRDEQRPELDAWCKVIESTVVPLHDGGDRWARMHVPFTHSAPWVGDELTPEEIFHKNSDLIWRQAAGLIVFARRGGSIGAGQEMAWAQLVGLPILVLVYGRHPDADGGALGGQDRLSRQVEGSASEADVTCEWFASANELDSKVRRWLSAKRRVIEDVQRVRNMHRQRAAVMLATFQAAAARMGPDATSEIQALMRIDAGRVARLLTDVDALLAASCDELLRLSTALDLDLGRAMSPPPEALAPPAELAPEQLTALEQAAVEDGWDAATIVRAVQLGQARLTSQGADHKRVALRSPEDWMKLVEDGRAGG